MNEVQDVREALRKIEDELAGERLRAIRRAKSERERLGRVARLVRNEYWKLLIGVATIASLCLAALVAIQWI